MQQTNTYKLNLIEMDDVFSADPLNDNAEKLEAQLVQAAGDLAAEAATRAAADAAEVKARTDAIAAEASTRAAADNAEAKARADAITAEANARIAADNAEAKARADADTAETNARKTADTTEANTRAAAITALDTRIKTLEAHKMVTGTYTGSVSSDSSTAKTITLGFQPTAVIVFGQSYGGMALPNAPFRTSAIVVTTTGFKAANSGTTLMNYTNWPYHYIAFL